MSVLEFIAALKWPIVVLVALFTISRGLKRNPGFSTWAKGWLDGRNVKGKIGPAELDLSMSEAGAGLAAGLAAASDEQLAALVAPERESADQEENPTEVTTLRREAVEDVMKFAAEWGWLMAKSEWPTLPQLNVVWNDQGQPTIHLPHREIVKEAFKRLDKIRGKTPGEELRATYDRLYAEVLRSHAAQSGEAPPTE